LGIYKRSSDIDPLVIGNPNGRINHHEWEVTFLEKSIHLYPGVVLGALLAPHRMSFFILDDMDILISASIWRFGFLTIDFYFYV